MILTLKLFPLTLVNPENGALRIVDRKKDLVKLQMGEYVSLGKVENALKLHPVVENVCVFASPLKTTTVALIVPDEVTLRQIHDREHGRSSPVTPSRSVVVLDGHPVKILKLSYQNMNQKCKTVQTNQIHFLQDLTQICTQKYNQKCNQLLNFPVHTKNYVWLILW